MPPRTTKPSQRVAVPEGAAGEACETGELTERPEERREQRGAALRATEGPFEVSVWPDQALVKSGESLVVNCSTNCPDPGPSGIETFLKKTQRAQWKEFLLEDVTKNSILQCFFSCAGIQKDRSLGITVYQPPEQVILELLPAWVALDEVFTVKCHVLRVAPLENLTLTLLQGNHELHRKTFMSLAVASQRAEVTIIAKAQREDHRCNFSCHAELDLRSHGGGLFHSSSASKLLQTFEFSQHPQIWVSPIMEVETAETVSCGMAQVFPAKELMFQIFFGDQELSPFLSWEGDTAWANATVRAMETGDQELSCLVSLGPMEQKTRELVHVYSFPPPVLEIEELYPLAGTDINVTSLLFDYREPQTSLPLGSPAWLLLTTREEDEAEIFSVRPLWRFRVNDKPRLEESGCPGNQTWMEGMEQKLACVPKGNPTPSLVCTWNGVIFDLQMPQKATQNHTGTYCCTATNQLGSVSKDIALTVQELNEDIISIVVVLIAALGIGIFSIALYFNYLPCKIERRKLPYRHKEENQEEERQFAVQAETCNAHDMTVK
ncbi:LOW QUALITY PROTEIN: hypothetical protein QTO34_009181 [Cnephaeus nilssonii]|uniref:Ig-like domain-containing protein n=1 Tax=Cnephaeus nilssonii TaxID=3371016 RepID=A0AA40LFV0_CNENI|nr:LOW QUALITY PROTEIN: hypothetical protein QTO34_009181 [Eptesicus nilssonii]